MTTYIPPLGFIGRGQATQAAQLVGVTMPRTAQRKKRAKSKSKRRASSGAKRRASTARKRSGRLVKGSAAAKRYMAKLRRMRKR